MEKTEQRVTLISAASELRAFADTIDGMEEDDPQREQAMLDMAQKAIQSREAVDGFCSFIRRLEAEQVFLKEEIDRLTERKARMTKLQESLEAYAIRAMKENGLRKFEGNTSTLQLRNNPDTAVIENEEAVPSKYKDLVLKVPATAWEHHIKWAMQDDPDGTRMLLDAVKAEVKVDKRKLLAALKEAEVPGADLRYGKDRLNMDRPRHRTIAAAVEDSV